MLKMASTSVNLRSPNSTGTATNCPGLYEFLLEAELQQYYSGLKNDLKVQTVAHIKYVEDDDLHQIGMTKPEMRRLKKYHHKYFPHTYLAKIRQMMMTKKDEHGHPAVVEVTESHTDKAAVKVPNKHIIGADNITVHKELGIGEFGVVQQGVWTNEEGERIQVAIKRLSSERMQNNTSDFLKEASIMHNIEHEHIVRLYGVVLDTNAFMLVTELAPLRSLLECVKEPALRPSFPVISLCDTALQICDGMRYLESKRLIHRDLAARNILVFAKNKVKISDFGLSRALGVGKDYYQTNFNVNLKLPIAWCAPECINYLRFTSASDVWAFGVTLWEMFSYGFQPWAALTGQQILEAIDEPHFQRLEQPDCCPKEYFTLMLRCWQHDPSKRPKFSEIFAILPELKSEQVQAIDDHEDLSSCSPKAKRDQLVYKVGDVITVLDKKPIADNPNVWKGVLATGKTGLFFPAHTVAYLGANIPSMKSSFVRGDSKNGGAYSSKRKLRPEMISRPQDDFKHTGHVGLDGAFFGDISFLGDKYNQLPKQIVTPYKPQDDHDQSSTASSSHLARALSDASDRAPLLGETALDSPVSRIAGCGLPETETELTAKVCCAAASPSGHGQQHRHQHRAPEQLEERQSASCSQADHEYHEISDEDQNQDDSCPAESQRLELFFQKCLDFGPSLMDEVFKALGTEQQHEENNTEEPDETHNARNEVRELAQVDCSSLSRKKKHQAGTVKPISASDEKTIDSAIAMANELAARSMSGSDMDSPRTPSSPGKRKFSFRFTTARSNGSTGGSPKLEKRNYSDRTACIPDVEDGLTESAKAAYSHLVEKVDVEEEVEEQEEEEEDADCAFVAPEETNPLRMLRSGFPVVRPKMRGNKHGVLSRSGSQDAARSNRTSTDGTYCDQSRSMENVRTQMSLNLNGNQHGPKECKETPNTTECCSEAETNPLPLPPRDRTKVLQPHRPRQRKHPLLVTAASSTARPLVRPSLSLSMPDVVSPTDEGSTEETATDRVNSPPTSSSSSFSVGTDAKSCLVSPTSPHSSFSSSSPGSSPSAEPVQGVRSPPPKPPRYSSLEESFDDQIQADIDGLDDIPEEEAPMPPIYKSSDHVSCEDLLYFACDRPNAKRTQGRARGVDSDEVRIMQKVLSTEVSPATCVGALNETEWDVHKAIKYLKLQLLLSHQLVSAASCKQTLMSCNWDVQKALRYLQSAFDVADDSTEV